jgi:plastocyanin
LIIITGVTLLGLLLLGAAVVLLSNGGGSEPDDATTVVDDASVTIEIVDFSFVQSNISVPRRARVTWLNTGSQPHDATENNRAWHTNLLEADDSETLTFDQPGSYDYYCTIHPGMRGKLVVR